MTIEITNDYPLAACLFGNNNCQHSIFLHHRHPNADYQQWCFGCDSSCGPIVPEELDSVVELTNMGDDEDLPILPLGFKQHRLPDA